ncbi:MAG TPA: hypothetical protein VLJ21_03310 [Candidatus Binatia bacterium]|nr:hypothetical protein [Candidatus Binatia bacterium]
MVTHKVVHHEEVDDADEIAVKSQFEAIHMKVKNGVEMGFKLALGFWLFTLLLGLLIVFAVLPMAGIHLPVPTAS